MNKSFIYIYIYVNMYVYILHVHICIDIDGIQWMFGGHMTEFNPFYEDEHSGKFFFK